MGELLTEIRNAISDRYEVQREIGAGGMATVFLAKDVRHHRRVAIKVLDPTLAAIRGPERFQREIRLAAQLNHPHILPVLDSGEFESNGQRIWYATPFMEGESLRERLRTEKQLPVSEAIRLATEVADALDYAHRQGVVHRDIKPDNILLQDGHARVADFGVALPLLGDEQVSLTQTGMAVGTPLYMSPEQATGTEAVDHRSDVYSLGCVLYESLVGAPPFSGATPMAIVAQALTQSPPKVSRDRPAAVEAQSVLDRALARLPADRYQSAGEMAEALRRLGTGEREAALPSPAPRARSKRLLVGAAVLAVAVILVLGVWIGLPSGGSATGEATIVVLPFRPIGDDAGHIVDGITFATRDRLAVLRGIAVVGATSSSLDRFSTMATTEIARELGTDYVLTATVEQHAADGSIEVRPNLIGANGTQIDFWNGGSVLAPSDQPGVAEATIAADVARALDLTVGAAARANLVGPAGSPVAYGLFLRGMGLQGQQRLARMEEALAVDSTMALARGPLAAEAMNDYAVSYAPQDSAALLEHATAAIRHAPDFAGGYADLGLYHRTVTFQYDSAVANLEHARTLAPGDADVGHLLASALWSAGRLEEALVEARRGAGLDPLSTAATSRVSRILFWMHRLEEAGSRHEETQALDNVAGWILADGSLLQAALGQLDSARAYVSAASLDQPGLATATFLNDIIWQGWLVDATVLSAVCQEGSEVSSGFAYIEFHRQIGCALFAWREGDTVTARALSEVVRSELQPVADRGTRNRRVYMGLAYANFLLGNEDEALRMADTALERLPAFWDYYPGAFNSVMYAQLAGMTGDADRAVRQLELMLEGYSPMTPDWLRADPAFDPIRDDPRFQALLRRR